MIHKLSLLFLKKRKLLVRLHLSIPSGKLTEITHKIHVMLPSVVGSPLLFHALHLTSHREKWLRMKKKLMYLPSLLIAISFLFHNQAAKGTESIGQLVFVMHHSWSKSYSTKVCICMYRSVHQQRMYTPENTIVGYIDIFSGRKCV